MFFFTRTHGIFINRYALMGTTSADPRRVLQLCPNKSHKREYLWYVTWKTKQKTNKTMFSRSMLRTGGVYTINVLLHCRSRMAIDPRKPIKCRGEACRVWRTRLLAKSAKLNEIVRPVAWWAASEDGTKSHLFICCGASKHKIVFRCGHFQRQKETVKLVYYVTTVSLVLCSPRIHYYSIPK